MGITNDYPQLVPPRGPVHGPQKPHFPENPRTKPTMAAECPGPSFGAQKTEKKGQKGHHFQAHGGYPFLAPLISHNSKAPTSAPQVGHQRGTQKPTAANPKPKRGLTHYGFMLGFFWFKLFLRPWFWNLKQHRKRNTCSHQGAVKATNHLSCARNSQLRSCDAER